MGSKINANQGKPHQGSHLSHLSLDTNACLDRLRLKLVFSMFALLLFLICYPQDSIGDESADFIVIKDNRKQLHLERTQPLSPGQWLWRRGNIGIKIDSSSFKISNENFNDVFAVSFANKSKLSKLMKSLDATLLFDEGQMEVDGFALFRPKTVAQLNLIANLAHRPQGLGCGNLQLIGSHISSGLEDYTPPLYNEQTKLEAVAALIKIPAPDTIQANVQKLQDLGSRFHSHPQFASATRLVLNLMLAAADGKIENFTATEVAHTSSRFTNQKSVIARIPGTSPESGTIILGAHLDSISSPNNSDAPGADDDASGIAVLIETINSIAMSNATFERNIEFHAYAAEEVGLIGSKDIALKYRTAEKKINAMLQLDMVSWSQNREDKTIFLINADTSSFLVRSLKDLLNTYLGGDYQEQSLTAGTSDHNSWNASGYHAVFPFEDPNNYNEAIHTPRDTIDTINNFGLATRFAQLNLAFLSHHAGLTSAASEYRDSINAQKQLEEDIKVAVIENPEQSTWLLAVAAPPSTARIETCIAPATDASTCVRSFLALTDPTEKGGRNFFKTATYNQFHPKHGEIRLLTAYDANDKLILQRTITLIKK